MGVYRLYESSKEIDMGKDVVSVRPMIMSHEQLKTAYTVMEAAWKKEKSRADSLEENMNEQSDFLSALTNLINRYSIENQSNTPDFILAQYLEGCLAVFTTSIQQRETWYDRDARPSSLESGK